MVARSSAWERRKEPPVEAGQGVEEEEVEPLDDGPRCWGEGESETVWAERFLCSSDVFACTPVSHL